MKILVAIKQVPDTETKIKVASDGRSLDPADVKWITSPYDRSEERRVGKECLRLCRSRWSPYH